VKAGTKRVVFSQLITNTQSENLVFPSMILMNGFDFTIQKVNGTDRAFDASVRKIA
jgi:hypothetical protein